MTGVQVYSTFVSLWSEPLGFVLTGGNIRVEDILGTLSVHFALTEPRATTPDTEFIPGLLDEAWKQETNE